VRSITRKSFTFENAMINNSTASPCGTRRDEGSAGGKTPAGVGVSKIHAGPFVFIRAIGNWILIILAVIGFALLAEVVGLDDPEATAEKDSKGI
jgi:hypothetical protein